MLNRLSWENRNRRSFPIFHGKWFRLPTQHTHTSTMVVDGTRQWTRTKKTSGRRTISTFSGRGFPFDKAPALTTVGRCDSEGFAVTTYCRVCGSADSRSSGAINQPTLPSKKTGRWICLIDRFIVFVPLEGYLSLAFADHRGWTRRLNHPSIDRPVVTSRRADRGH